MSPLLVESFVESVRISPPSFVEGDLVSQQSFGTLWLFCTFAIHFRCKRNSRNTAMRYSTVYSLAGLLALVWAEEEFELETAVTVFETYIPVRALVSTISLISSRLDLETVQTTTLLNRD